jgi:hypothetical protein
MSSVDIDKIFTEKSYKKTNVAFVLGIHQIKALRLFNSHKDNDVEHLAKYSCSELRVRNQTTYTFLLVIL